MTASSPAGAGIAAWAGSTAASRVTAPIRPATVLSIDGILLTTTLPAILRRPDGSAAGNTRPRKSVPARVALDDHIFGMIAEVLQILDFHRINDRTTSFYTS